MKNTKISKIAAISAIVCTFITGGVFSATASAAGWTSVYHWGMPWATSNYQTVYWSSANYGGANGVQYAPVTFRAGRSIQVYQVPLQSNYTPVQSTPAPVQPPVIITPAPSTTPVASQEGVSADQQQAINLMNADRAAYGLPPLRTDSRLAALGQAYAQDMMNRNFFSHTNPEGQSPFDRMQAAGISYQYAGENIAINSSISGAENAFMNSPGHRANILNNNYTSVGIGVAYAPNGQVYVSQEFIGN